MTNAETIGQPVLEKKRREQEQRGRGGRFWPRSRNKCVRLVCDQGSRGHRDAFPLQGDRWLRLLRRCKRKGAGGSAFAPLQRKFAAELVDSNREEP